MHRILRQCVSHPSRKSIVKMYAKAKRSLKKNSMSKKICQKEKMTKSKMTKSKMTKENLEFRMTLTFRMTLKKGFFVAPKFPSAGKIGQRAM